MIMMHGYGLCMTYGYEIEICMYVYVFTDTYIWICIYGYLYMDMYLQILIYGHVFTDM